VCSSDPHKHRKHPNKMHSILTRLNQVFMFALTTLAVIALIANVTARFHTPEPQVNISFSNIILTPSKNSDEAFVRFDLDANLTSLFTWNTKQLVIAVVADYKTEKNRRNEVVIWDDIITSKQKALISARDIYSEYRFRDQGFGLRSNVIGLRLKWNHMPFSGLMEYDSAGLDTRTFPDSYRRQ